MCHGGLVDPQSQATWISAVPDMLMIAALILPPGWVVARACGMRPIEALGVAPASGTFVLLVAATVAAVVGADWGPVVGLTLIVLVTALAAGAGRLMHGPPVRGARMHKGQLAVFAGTVMTAASVMAWQFISGTRRPDALAQMPDAPFHLTVVRDLVEAGSASPWTSGESVWYSPGVFYPGGFHSVAATAQLWGDVDLDVACHATLLVFTSVFWPLSLIVLARVTASDSTWVVPFAGALSVATTFSVLAVMPVGAVWAYTVSASLLPALLIPVLRMSQLRRAPAARHLAGTLALLVATVSATALCQPSAVFAVALLGLPLVGPSMLRWGWAWAVLWLVIVGMAAAVWVVFFPPSVLDIPIGGDSNLRRAVLVMLKGGDLPLLGGLGAMAFTGVGLIASIRRWESAGLAFAWLVTFLLFLSVQYDTGLEMQRVGWPWYSGAARISLLFAIPALLCAAYGCTWIEGVLRRYSSAGGVSALGLGLGLVIVSTMVPAAAERVRDSVRLGYYPADTAFTYVTDEEVAALGTLAAQMPADGATALDPFRGGMYLSMYGRRTMPVAPFSSVPAEGTLIDHALASATTEAEVCEAVRDLGITTVLTGGSRAKFYSPLDPRAPGIDAVPGASGFTLLARAEPYSLYRVPSACIG